MNMHAKVTSKQMVWTAAMKQHMAKMWNEGQSAAMIADRFDTSRSAVIGIANRNPTLFKSKKEKPKYKRTGGVRPMARNPDADPDPQGMKIHNIHKARMEAARREADEFGAGTSEYLQIAPTDAERLNTGMGKELMDLSVNECRFALNNGGPFVFCAEATDGVVYCRHHAGRAYRPRLVI